MASLLRDLVPLLAVAGLVLGSAVLIGGLVALAGRLESWRIRRAFARIEGSLERATRRPEPLAIAYRIDSLEGMRAGYELRLSTAAGGSSPFTGGASGPTSMRALVTKVSIRWTEDARLDALGPPPTESQRASWIDRIRIDEGARAASLSIDPPRRSKDVESFWIGVRVAASLLEDLRPMAKPSAAPASNGARASVSAAAGAAGSAPLPAPPLPAAIPAPIREASSMKLPPPPRFLSPSGTPSETEPSFVLAACTSDFRCLGAVFVGPFVVERAAEAWTLLEGEYRYSNAYFVVFACLRAPSPGIDALRSGAAAVMDAMTVYTTGRVEPLERYFVVVREGDTVALDPDHRLPAHASAVAAMRAASAVGSRAHALVALCGVDWHAHM